MHTTMCIEGLGVLNKENELEKHTLGDDFSGLRDSVQTTLSS